MPLAIDHHFLDHPLFSHDSLAFVNGIINVEYHCIAMYVAVDAN